MGDFPTKRGGKNAPVFLSFATKRATYHLNQGFSKRPSATLGATERLSKSHEQKPSLGGFAEAFTSIAKPKCHDNRYLPNELKFVVFIITL